MAPARSRSPLRLAPFFLSLRRLAVRAGLLALAAALALSAAQDLPYVPGEVWERRSPAQAGMDPERLRDAVAFAVASESSAPRDLLEAHHQGFGREPFGAPIGPFAPRGEASGLILRGGYLVAEWGEPERVDMAFSVTKSFLSSVVGLAYDRGLIPDLDAPVREAMAPVLTLAGPDDPGGTLLDPFASEQARSISWDHLLRQTSDWQGTLWGKPDWADRPGDDPATWRTRSPNPPGSVFEYNDVRVNLLALAALNVWRRPLPEVLDELLMTPIGASRRWRWFGYDTSWVVIDGRAVQSVSGGGHWGGGMFIDSYDMARFGLLTLRRGRWGERRILSEEWVERALTPTPAAPNYGVMNWFLNTGRRLLPSAPATAVQHLGSGVNMIYVDYDNDLVIVARWIEDEARDPLVRRVLAAIEGR